MTGFEDWYQSEIEPDDSPLERARDDAELREWEAEIEQDRLRRDDPCWRLSAALRPPVERREAA